MPALTAAERQAKLRKLAELEGFESVEAMFDVILTSGPRCLGICTTMIPFCEYTAEVAVAERAGQCPICGTATVQSAAVLAGIV